MDVSTFFTHYEQSLHIAATMLAQICPFGLPWYGYDDFASRASVTTGNELVCMSGVFAVAAFHTSPHPTKRTLTRCSEMRKTAPASFACIVVFHYHSPFAFLFSMTF